MDIYPISFSGNVIFDSRIKKDLLERKVNASNAKISNMTQKMIV
jgi:hypothetical protein